MIHRIRVQNFRSLRDVTVNLSPVTVFVGKSGTGKTNFASAVRFLRDYLASGPQGVSSQGQNCRCATNPSGSMEFEVAFSIPEFCERFTYVLRLHEQDIGILQTEALSYGDDTVFMQVRQTNNRHQWESEPRLTSVPNPGALALRRLPGLEEAVVAHAALTDAIGIYNFPYSVLAANAARQQQGVAGFADNGSNYLDILVAFSRDLQKGIAVRKAIAATLRRINETVASVELDSLQNPQKAIVGHRLGNKTLELELSQESDGFRRFYAHLLALYQMPRKQTLVFEEPENGIYPGALELLADEFKAAPDDNRGQVWLTTHSPALLDHFSADQIRVVELVDLETKIGPLAEEQKEAIQEELLHAGELLTVDPARRSES